MNLDTKHTRPKAVVLLSGGLDSATVAALAQSEGYDIFAISFDYGQRHKAELVAASRIASQMKACDHKIIRIDLNGMGGSALTDESLTVPDFQQRAENEIPITYVPARNLTFLSFALGWAEVLGARHIFIGVNAVDYSGYPDCRPEFIAQFERVANLATATDAETAPFRIIAPLQYLTKAQIIQMGAGLGVDYRQTVSCYSPDLEGRACGRCDACHYRRQGFDEAGLLDATVYQ
jgi:7-cyano-7-deazaguanine synthase